MSRTWKSLRNQDYDSYETQKNHDINITIPSSFMGIIILIPSLEFSRMVLLLRAFCTISTSVSDLSRSCAQCAKSSTYEIREQEK